MTVAAPTPRSADVSVLGPADHARVCTRVLLSPVVKGPVVRRPRAVNLAERIDADAAGVSELQSLRRRYGPGPVQLRVPGRRIALLLDPEDVHHVLNGAPEPFAPDLWLRERDDSDWPLVPFSGGPGMCPVRRA